MYNYEISRGTVRIILYMDPWEYLEKSIFLWWKIIFGFEVRVNPDVKPLKVYGMQKSRRFGLQSQFYPKNLELPPSNNKLW